MGRVRKDSVHDSSFANNKPAKLSTKKLTTNNLCTKCKKEERRQNDTCTICNLPSFSLPKLQKISNVQITTFAYLIQALMDGGYNATVVQSDDNGEFSGDYYCLQCKELDILEHSSSEKEYTPNRKLSISSASSSRSSGSTSHKKLKSNNGTSHIPSPEPYILDNGTNSTTEAEHDNNNHSPHGVQGLQTQSKPTCKLQKITSPTKRSNSQGNNEVERQETVSITTSTVSVSETTLFHPYNFPNPISYNRALLRVAQIREFILTHCPAATRVESIDGAENSNNRPVSLKLAEELWKKMERLEKTHDRRKYNKQ
ncbi:6340_t:CDS:2 [Racocetra persica]|uniref:6340_t:CDS:1 n=1 Tax=Racocetra persica TaxID=160502 RepID=A0ACA9PNJ0_9GLOM|nr:6340_t:CDS:2 [Racocetra persica]